MNTPDEFGLVHNTPVEPLAGHKSIFVKREDLCAPDPGPGFSKYRGVVEHIKHRPEQIIGVLDTVHSRGGWAVAYACKLLGRMCWDFYPVYKSELTKDPKCILRPIQQKVHDLGGALCSLQAGRSAVIYHTAKRVIAKANAETNMGAYMMPNALKLPESVTNNAAEAFITPTREFKTVILSVSSGTIAAGVIKGILHKGESPLFILHLGYKRSTVELRSYIESYLDFGDRPNLRFVDESYDYAEAARDPITVEFPCDPFYDLKALTWTLRNQTDLPSPVLMWNAG